MGEDTQRQCAANGCTRVIKAAGLCSRHYNETLTKALCTFDGCGRAGYCRGLCLRHYEQQNKGKPLTPIRSKLKKQPVMCTEEGCGNKARRRGLCPMHAYRVDTYGDPGGPDSWRRTGCQKDGCQNPHQAHGYCAKHLRRYQLYGDPNGHWMPQQCKTPGCTRVALSPRSRHGKGYCVRCYLNQWLDDYQAGRITAARVPRQGYEYVSVNKTRYSVHRLVMEREEGRELLPFEFPHHKNGIRHDNRPENLELWMTPHPHGQRPEDLAAWMWGYYPVVVDAVGKAMKRDKKSGQLCLVN